MSSIVPLTKFPLGAELPRLLTEAEVLEHYESVRLSSRMLRRARNAQRLRFVLIGRTVCYTEEAVAEWLATEERECRDTARTRHSKSEGGGWTASAEAPSGTAFSFTPKKAENH